MKISRACPLCGKPQEVEVSDAAYEKYKSGALIQDAFPDLTPDQREILLSGICPECWETEFGTDE